MKLNTLSLIITDDCNFRCAYCFQTKDKKYLAPETLTKGIRFFYPYFEAGVNIIFFGGEPLLAFEHVRQAVSLLAQLNSQGDKSFTYHLTTNGSLLTPEMLHYFAEHGFLLMLSFDGFSQNTTRHPDSLENCRKLLQEIKHYPQLHFSTNSVFDHQTVAHLAESLVSIWESGVSETLLSISSYQTWTEDQLQVLTEQYGILIKYLLQYYQEKGIIPIPSFRPNSESKSERFVCSAGADRMNIDPEGNIWGCHLFYDLLKERKNSEDYMGYCFGSLEDFMAAPETLYKRAMQYYNDLRQEYFFTEEKLCFTCQDLNTCRICPVNAAYNTDLIGKIPPHLCRLMHIQHEAKSLFLEQLAILNANKKK